MKTQLRLIRCSPPSFDLGNNAFPLSFQVEFKTPTGMVSASARVKNAMLAAAKYKKQIREQAVAAEGSS